MLSMPSFNSDQKWDKQILKKIKSVFYSKQEPPILFKPKKSSRLEKNIQKLIKHLNVRIPIIYIEKNKYLLGSNRCTFSLKRDEVLIRVGGGYERFEKYLASNHL